MILGWENVGHTHWGQMLSYEYVCKYFLNNKSKSIFYGEH